MVLIIGAWNYPVQLTLLPLVGALAAGNCACIKVPSDKYSSATSKAIAELLPRYLDTNAVTVVEGDRHATQAVLKERWDMIFFTGNTSITMSHEITPDYNIVQVVRLWARWWRSLQLNTSPQPFW